MRLEQLVYFLVVLLKVTTSSATVNNDTRRPFPMDDFHDIASIEIEVPQMMCRPPGLLRLT